MSDNIKKLLKKSEDLSLCFLVLARGKNSVWEFMMLLVIAICIIVLVNYFYKHRDGISESICQIMSVYFNGHKKVEAAKNGKQKSLPEESSKPRKDKKDS